jgi:hypothetical protein
VARTARTRIQEIRPAGAKASGKAVPVAAPKAASAHRSASRLPSPMVAAAILEGSARPNDRERKGRNNAELLFAQVSPRAAHSSVTEPPTLTPAPARGMVSGTARAGAAVLDESPPVVGSFDRDVSQALRPESSNQAGAAVTSRELASRPAAPKAAAPPPPPRKEVSAIAPSGKRPGAVPAVAPEAAVGAHAPAQLTGVTQSDSVRDGGRGGGSAPAVADAIAAEAPVDEEAQDQTAPSAEKGAPAAEKAASSAGTGKGAPEGDSPAEKEKAPVKPPSPRETVAPTVGAVRQRARKAQKHSEPPDTPIRSAQAAAITKGTEQKRLAAAATVVKLDDAKEGARALQRETFKTKFKEAIEAATPKPTTEADANKVVESGAKTASTTMRGQLATQRDEAAGPLKTVATGAEESPANQPAPAAVTMEPEPLGPKPAPVAPGPVVPEPLPPERLDYSADRAPSDRAMAENNVSQEQLAKGNDPEFGPTLEARSTAEQHEAEAEAKYRKSEAGVQARAEKQAGGALTAGLGDIHGARAASVAKVVGQQVGTNVKDLAERQRVTETIDGIKTKTKGDVETILKEMEVEATRIFGEGLTAAEKAYRDTFEEEKGGLGTWLTTWGDDWKELIESSLGKARTEYLRQVDLAIDKVADVVDKKLNDAKERVASGRKEVDDFVAGLQSSVKQFGEDAASAVAADFDGMSADIDARGDALVNTLVQQFKESYDRMSAMEEELRAANKSLWERVYDATIGLIKKILAFKDMLLSILAKAADVVLDIISDPIGFLGNLVSGVMLGLKNFMGNIAAHLKKGLMDWLFGALGGAGLVMPDTFDLKGIISIVLQVLGLTYANFRARAVKIVGEPVVAALEQAAEVFKIVITEGIPGLWRFIKEKLEDLKSMVLDAIFDFIKEKVIVAGVTWVIGLLNPASAFFKACKAIYDIVMFFIERGSQIIELVNAVIDSMASIAKGNIAVAAKFVENALAKAIPVAIGFLASLLGLGDISGTIRKTIEKAQAPVNKAIDWVINGAVKLVKTVGKFVGGLVGGKKEKKPDKVGHDEDPEKAAKISAGLVTLHQTEQGLLQDGKLTRANAQKVAAQTRTAHPVFTSITVERKGSQWAYDWTASPGNDEDGADVDESDEIIEYTAYYRGRPSWKQEIRDAYPVQPAEHRRHVELWSARHSTVVAELYERTVSQGIKILRAKFGTYGPDKIAPTLKACYDAAHHYLHEWFNDPAHFWVGAGSPNSAMGAAANQAKKRILDNINNRGDVQAFRDDLEVYKENAYDPDPSGAASGSKAIVMAQIRVWKKDFKEKWGKV